MELRAFRVPDRKNDTGLGKIKGGGGDSYPRLLLCSTIARIPICSFEPEKQQRLRSRLGEMGV